LYPIQMRSCRTEGSGRSCRSSSHAQYEGGDGGRVSEKGMHNEKRGGDNIGKKGAETRNDPRTSQLSKNQPLRRPARFLEGSGQKNQTSYPLAQIISHVIKAHGGLTPKKAKVSALGLAKGSLED